MARINLGKVVPEKGIDYFTDAEVEEIKNEIKVEIDAQGMARDIELLKTDSGHSVELTLDPQTYQIVLVLKNAAGTALSTQTIDLPNENAITNLVYNNGILTVTKQSGATSQINLTGLIEGLVTENDFNTFKEALQTTLEAINEKDAEQDEAIAENYKVINKLNEKLENQQKVIDQLPKVEGQGTEVTLENTIKAQFTKFDEEGNSEQESTKGYQLLKYPYANTTKTLNGVTFTDNGDGSIKINGTATEEAAFDLQWSNIVPAGSYTYIIFNLPNNCFANYYGIGNKYGENVGTLTRDSEYNMGSNIHIPAGVTVSNVTVYPMLVSGTYTRETIPNWEKYTGGTASPNPNYEQPIKSAGDNENILPYPYLAETKTMNGVTFKVNKDGTIIANGTATANAYFMLKGDIDLNGTYTIGTGLGTSESTYMALLDQNDKWIDKLSTKTSNRETATVNSKFQAYIYVTQGTTVDNLVFRPKIEKGNKATPYSPYGMGSINQKIINKNVISSENIDVTFMGVKYLSQDNGTILANGKKYGGAYFNLTDTIVTLENETYSSKVFLLNGSISRDGTNIHPTVYLINQADTTKSYSIGGIGNPGKSQLIEAGTYYLRIATWEDNVIFANAEIGIMLVKESPTPTTFVEHQEQDYSIFVQQPMRSIGDVRDCFVKKDGKWYERHSIAGYIITGNENWVIEREGTLVALYKLSTGALFSNKQLCNYKAICVRYSADPNSFFLANDNIRMYNDWNFATAQEAKAKFKELYDAGKPIYIHYILETPLDLPCTEEQIQQLENKPSTYKDFTIIQSEDETPAYLEVAGIYDLNKLITRVEVLESEV